jgi:hypothetical protein
MSKPEGDAARREGVPGGDWGGERCIYKVIETNEIMEAMVRT